MYEVVYTVHSYATKIEKKKNPKQNFKNKLKKSTPLPLSYYCLCVEVCAVAIKNPVETVRLDL